MASDSDTVIQALRRAARGASDDGWLPPAWLLGHQPDAALRIAGSLQVFGGALLADAVGLGKTYVSLAVSTRYHRTAAIVPASLVSQWRDVAERLGTPVTLVSHEALSRGRRVPQADLIIVDEAHRFRNSASRRYDRLARDRGRSHLLLVTATPVVNHCRDLVSLLHLFLADNSLAILGLPSLEQAVADRDYTAIAHASAPLVVARSTRVLSEALSIPHPTDRRVSRTPSLPIHDLERLTDDIGSLTFPGTGVRQAVELLRAHLLHRLASSPAACRETLRRHLAYLDRALAAFANGQAIARGTARQLLGHG
ncbi:MAG: SNF2-related protein, partial [Gemmatimonadales bacterium]